MQKPTNEKGDNFNIVFKLIRTPTKKASSDNPRLTFDS